MNPPREYCGEPEDCPLRGKWLTLVSLLFIRDIKIYIYMGKESQEATKTMFHRSVSFNHLEKKEEPHWACQTVLPGKSFSLRLKLEF